MKGLSLEQLRSELDSDARRRCEAQEKTIKEQAELIQKLREERSIATFCPFDNLVMKLMNRGMTVEIDGSNYEDESVLITTKKGGEHITHIRSLSEITSCHFDLTADILSKQYCSLIERRF